MAERIQRKRAKGWRMPPTAIYVGRPSIWGNPFKAAAAIEAGYLSPRDTPHEVAAFLTGCFADWLKGAGSYGGRDWWWGPESDARRQAILANLTKLRGHDLACWCPLDRECHADILLALANNPRAPLQTMAAGDG